MVDVCLNMCVIRQICAMRCLSMCVITHMCIMVSMGDPDRHSADLFSYDDLPILNGRNRGWQSWFEEEDEGAEWAAFPLAPLDLPGPGAIPVPIPAGKAGTRIVSLVALGLVPFVCAGRLLGAIVDSVQDAIEIVREVR